MNAEKMNHIMKYGWIGWVILLSPVSGTLAGEVVTYPDGYQAYYSDYPPEVYDFCMERFRRSTALLNCMRYQNRIKRDLDAFLLKELKDDDLRERVYKNCLGELSQNGMDSVDHCVRTEVSYRKSLGQW
jgi:hypothetical protein